MGSSKTVAKRLAVVFSLNLLCWLSAVGPGHELSHSDPGCSLCVAANHSLSISEQDIVPHPQPVWAALLVISPESPLIGSFRPDRARAPPLS